MSKVSEWRRRTKIILVEEHGGKCVDCGYVGPPFMFDFDHRVPDEKEFKVSGSKVAKLETMRTEAAKCDLVCCMCHRMRTHKQRCFGCEYCDGV